MYKLYMYVVCYLFIYFSFIYSLKGNINEYSKGIGIKTIFINII